MERRSFLKALGLPFFRGRERETSPAHKRIFLGEFFIAGFQFHEGMRKDVLRSLFPGDVLTVVREPQNGHDRAALALHTQAGAMIGYVPRTTNEVPALIAEQGVVLGAEIIALDLAGSPWERVRVKLFQNVDVRT